MNRSNKYKNYSILIYIVLCAIGMHECVEPFNPEIKEYENLLVVDGMISNTDTKTTVKLSRTYSYQSIYPNPEKGAIITLYDNDGNFINLTEVTDGIYKDLNSSIKGEVGKSYRIFIETTSGEVYESEYQILKESPPIDTIYCKYEGQAITEAIYPDQKMIFYLGTHDPTNNTKYYRWEWIETWEFHAPIGSANYLSRQICWDSSFSASINLGNTLSLSQNEIENYKIKITDNKTEKLGKRYSLLIKQYALNPEQFTYWSELEKINENGGTLFDPIPSQITGNITNINNPEEPVLGFFQVCGVSEKRITIDRSQLPLDFITLNTSDCGVFKVPGEYDIAIYIQLGWYYIDSVWDELNGFPAFVHRFSKRQSCFDCTTLGTNRKPEYWDQINTNISY